MKLVVVHVLYALFVDDNGQVVEAVFFDVLDVRFKLSHELVEVKEFKVLV